MITVKTVKGIKYAYHQSTVDGKRIEKSLGRLDGLNRLEAMRLIEEELDNERKEMYTKLGAYDEPEQDKDVQAMGFKNVRAEYLVLSIAPKLKDAIEDAAKKNGFENSRAYVERVFADYLYGLLDKRQRSKFDVSKDTDKKQTLAKVRELKANLNIAQIQSRLVL